MVLSELIHKNKTGQVATATGATPATNKRKYIESVANVASVAVANPDSSESNNTNILVECYSPAGNSIVVTAKNEEHATWLRQVNPKPHE